MSRSASPCSRRLTRGNMPFLPRHRRRAILRWKVFAAQAGATEEKAYERLREVRFVQPDGSEYPTGMNLSGGISNLDQWPQVEVKQMIGTEKIPERIGMSFAGGQQPIQLTLKK